MSENEGKFRFAYFTDKYDETCDFCKNKLGLDLEHSWNRNEHDKGTVQGRFWIN